MQFLFATRNWASVTLSLWGDIQADIKIPILLLIFFLVGFLPTWLIMRAKLWACRRRLDVLERPRPVSTAAAANQQLEEQEPTE